MPASNTHDLPRRLQPVLLELVEGKANAEIAETLGFQVHTVEKYVSDLLHHFDCRNRGELIARVLRGEFGDLKVLGRFPGRRGKAYRSSLARTKRACRS
jgi:DNA-binding NarL/FixJ family response regulator